MPLPARVQIVEVGPRDGLQNEKQRDPNGFFIHNGGPRRSSTVGFRSVGEPRR